MWALFSALWRVLLFLASPRKSKQKEGDPRSVAPAGLPCATRAWRGRRKLGAAPLKHACPSSAKPCVARHLSRGKVNPPCLNDVSTGWFSLARRQRRATEALAEKGRGLSEGRSPEFRSPRQRRVAQGTRTAGADAGSPFLCGLSFGEAKESPARLKREKQRLHERQTHKPWPDPGLQTPTRASCSRLDG